MDKKKKRNTHFLIEAETYVRTAQMVYEFFKECEKNGDLECRIVLSKKITPKDIEWADIIMSIRSMNLLSTHLSQLCKKHNRIHAILLDDNLFLHSRTDYFMKMRQKELKNTLNVTDVAFVSNKLLAEYLNTNYNVSRFVKLDSAVDETSINFDCKIKVEKKDCYKVVYYANDGRTLYFKNVLENVLKSLDEKITIKLFIDCIGMDKITINLNHIQLRYIPRLSLHDFRQYLANENYDFGIAPLPYKDGFSEYKYFNKFIEFSMAGIPGIYSNCPPYNFIIKDNINGILCRNSEEEWSSSILQMISDTNLRENVIKNAQNQLSEEFSTKFIYSKCKDQFPEIIKYRAPIVKVKNFKLYKIKYALFIIMEKINSVYRYFKKGGISAVFDRTKYYVMVFKQSKEDLK